MLQLVDLTSAEANGRAALLAAQTEATELASRVERSDAAAVRMAESHEQQLAVQRATFDDQVKALTSQLQQAQVAAAATGQVAAMTCHVLATWHATYPWHR